MGSRIHVHPNGSLAIKTVTEKDAGDYICVARNKMGDDLILMKVSVTMKPAKIDQKQYFMKLVPYGKDFKVDCKASGAPEPEISWSLPDGTMINNVMQADDSGHRSRRYTLFDNGTLYFNKMLRRPMFRNPFNEKVIAKSGKTTFLNCSVDGNPPPEIMWMLPNGTRLSSGFKTARYFLESNGTLVIYGLSNADSGKYRCAAKNKVGYIEKLIILEVGQKPTIFIHPKGTVKGISGESLFLHCLAGGNPKPNIIWTKYTLLENGTLVIQETTIHDRGSYTCKAQNYAGDSTVTVFMFNQNQSNGISLPF
uniref:Immunoglobulin superfamily member 10 n=1 Tax=Varanus komodoensis TaxID=61221 RepID=A0A8D2LQ03_VARKO